MAEEAPATATATVVSPMAEQPPVSKEELAPEERSDIPAEEAPEAKETDSKRKLEDLEKEAEEAADLEKKAGEVGAMADGDAVGDAKRQKVNGNGDADGFGVDGVLNVQKLEASMVGNGQPPSTEDIHSGSVEFLQQSEVVSERGTHPSDLQDAPSSRQIKVANNKVGILIGRAGETIRNLQCNSGGQIQIARDAEADPNSTTRPIELIGTLEQINKAEQLIKDVIAEADAGGSPALIAQGHGATQFGSEVFEIHVPNEKVGIIIGKGGETIKNLQTTSGARIQLIPQHLPEGEVSKERTLRITGNQKQIEAAKEMVKNCMHKVPVRPSPLSGGYSESHRPRGPDPVTQWGPRAPPPAQNHPQPPTGYGYQHTSNYPSQPTQYPPPYGGGYPQHPYQQRFSAPVQTPPPTGGYNNYYGQGRPGMASQLSAQTPGAVNYNYGHQQQAPGYGQANPYLQSEVGIYGPPQHNYGPGYNEQKYDNQALRPQIYGQQQPASSQPAFYPQQGNTAPHPGYGQQPYAKPAPYSGGAPQSYGPPVIAGQPVDPTYQGPVPPYASVAPTQQAHPYDPTSLPSNTPSAYSQTHGPPPGGVDGYNQQPPPAGYSQPAYAQPGAQSGGYGQYAPTQPSYGEQPSANSSNYGYQGGPGDVGYNSVNPQGGGYMQPAGNPVSYRQAGGYAQPAANPASYPQAAGEYAQPAANPASHDQSAAMQYGHGSQQGSAPVGYAKGMSLQPGGYGSWAT